MLLSRDETVKELIKAQNKPYLAAVDFPALNMILVGSLLKASAATREQLKLVNKLATESGQKIPTITLLLDLPSDYKKQLKLFKGTKYNEEAEQIEISANSGENFGPQIFIEVNETGTPNLVINTILKGFALLQHRKKIDSNEHYPDESLETFVEESKNLAKPAIYMYHIDFEYFLGKLGSYQRTNSKANPWDLFSADYLEKVLLSLK